MNISKQAFIQARSSEAAVLLSLPTAVTNAPKQLRHGITRQQKKHYPAFLYCYINTVGTSLIARGQV